MDIEAANSAHLAESKEQKSYQKTDWKCPCQGCKKAEKRERERIADLLLEQHKLSANGEDRLYGRMAECMTNTCDCQTIIDMIIEKPGK